MLVVDVLVVSGVILGWFRLFRRDQWLGTGEVMILTTIASVMSWLGLSLLGLIVGCCAATSTTSVGEVVSLKADRDNPQLVVVRITDGNNLASFVTKWGIKLEETQEDQIVAKVECDMVRRPKWWPSVLSLFINEALSFGEPSVTIKGPKEKLKDILTAL